MHSAVILAATYLQYEIPILNGIYEAGVVFYSIVVFCSARSTVVRTFPDQGCMVQ